MFRNNRLSSALVMVLFVLGLFACLWAVRYFFSVREAQRLQSQYLALQQTMNGLQGLVAESVEYSRRNPDLDPLLQQFNLKPRPGTNAAPAVRPSR